MCGLTPGGVGGRLRSRQGVPDTHLLRSWAMFHPRTILLALAFHFGFPFLFSTCKEEASAVVSEPVPALCETGADSTLAPAGEVAFPWETVSNFPESEPRPRRAEP